MPVQPSLNACKAVVGNTKLNINGNTICRMTSATEEGMQISSITSVLATLKNGFKVPGSNLIKLHHAAVKTFLPGDFLEVTTFYEGVKSKVVFLSGGLINVTLLRSLNVAETSEQKWSLGTQSPRLFDHPCLGSKNCW